MANFYDNALKLFSSDPLSAGLLLLAGFLICHLLHAFIYGFVGGYGSSFEKIKKFFKGLFFIYK
ncbi:MAG: hypothetical protein WC376_03940 [Candidatus Nanoarchaeia archaeon]|jgi:hypothetical protein